MHLICCTGDNFHLTRIATAAGFEIGAQLPVTVYAKLFFADQNWRRPVRSKYMHGLAKYRPQMATVLDLERPDQLPEVLSWAEEAARYAEQLVVIPKYVGAIDQIPRAVGGKRVLLGYSVPTKYAGTTVPVEDFLGWPVHLLGGNPYQQLTLVKKIGVVSADCNVHIKMANTNCQWFSVMPNWLAKNSDWPMLSESDPGKRFENGRFEAFQRSCEEIQKFWRLHGIRITPRGDEAR